ncbi:FliM/FliN family flagellar motor switch protein [Stieleria varia]|uniref:FliM/FliN family flagellar motor switch protein n=1 Tax=Stieleria varia TaxID=2528005 RepID=UPI0018D248D4|nr:FliM/FliN family flagellar motor switch protein [Stieleria varia]
MSTTNQFNDNQVRRLVQAMEVQPSDRRDRPVGYRVDTAGRETATANVDYAEKDLLCKTHQQHDRVAKGFAESLSQIWQGPVQVSVHHVRRFLPGQPNVDPLNRLYNVPLPNAGIQIQSSLAFALIDRMLGGQPDLTDFAGRSMTVLEQRLLHRIIDDFVMHWQIAWRDGAVFSRSTIADAGFGRDLLTSMDSQHEMICVELNIQMTGSRGAWICVMPVSELACLSDRIIAEDCETAVTDESDSHSLSDHSLSDHSLSDHSLSDPEVEVTVTLEVASCDGASSPSLQVGECLTLDGSAPIVADIRVAGVVVRRGMLGQCDGRKVVRVDRDKG